MTEETIDAIMDVVHEAIGDAECATKGAYMPKMVVYRQAIIDAIAKERAEPMSPWISVEDRLPKAGLSVLAETRPGKVIIACHSNGIWNDEYNLIRDIKRWMPLPAAPGEPSTAPSQPTGKDALSQHRPFRLEESNREGYYNKVLTKDGDICMVIQSNPSYDYGRSFGDAVVGLLNSPSQPHVSDVIDLIAAGDAMHERLMMIGAVLPETAQWQAAKAKHNTLPT